MRLKTLIYTSVSILLLLFAVISFTLTEMTTRMHDEANQIRLALASVRTAQSIKVHLLEFARINSLLALTKNPKYRDESSKQEAAIYEWLNRAKKIERSPEEQGHLKNVEQNIFYYLKIRKDLAKKGLKRAIGESTGPLEKALGSLEYSYATIATGPIRHLQNPPKWKSYRIKSPRGQ